MTKERTKIASVSIKDCEVQSFRAGGPGGQKQNKTSSGARVIHHPSGARAECRETRSFIENRKRAFIRMIETKEFKHWMKLESARALGRLDEIEKQVDYEMEHNIKIEFREGGKWAIQNK